MQAFSQRKVVNKISANGRDSQHGRRHPSYKIVFDRKYIKLLNKRRYRRENLYEMFRTIYQTLNRVFLRLEGDMSCAKQGLKLDAQLVKKRLKISGFDVQRIKKIFMSMEIEAEVSLRFSTRYIESLAENTLVLHSVNSMLN